MLKIKDDIDLKQLEKFGFKPKYDEDTGKIKRYEKEKITIHGIRFIDIIKKNSGWIVGINNNEMRINVFDFSTLYDLIKADLVEKL